MFGPELGLIFAMTTAVILAGGLGTRLRSVVADAPKPMAPVGGRPFLEYQLDYWIGQGVREFMLSAGYRRAAIIDHFGDAYRGCTIRYAVEERPLGTGGGLLLALDRLDPGDEPFLLLNGDTFFAVNLAALRTFHREHVSDWTFSLFRAGESGRYMGIEWADDGRITDLGSALGVAGALANGGVYLIRPNVLCDLPWRTGDKVSLETDLVPYVFAAGARCYGFESAGRFIDIGVPDDYARAAAVLKEES